MLSVLKQLRQVCRVLCCSEKFKSPEAVPFDTNAWVKMVVPAGTEGCTPNAGINDFSWQAVY